MTVQEWIEPVWLRFCRACKLVPCIGNASGSLMTAQNLSVVVCCLWEKMKPGKTFLGNFCGNEDLCPFLFFLFLLGLVRGRSGLGGNRLMRRWVDERTLG